LIEGGNGDADQRILLLHLAFGFGDVWAALEQFGRHRVRDIRDRSR
jgi:hypothetical protein